MIKLSLRCCDNITLSQEACANLKIYKNIMNSSKTNSNNSSLQFPKVENFTFTGNYPKEIDFSSFKNLKVFYGTSDILLNLESPSLEKIESLTVEKRENIELSLIEKKIIEKLIIFKKIKEVELVLIEIDEKIISEIKGENNSLKKMNLRIYQGNDNTNNLVNSLKKNFQI